MVDKKIVTFGEIMMRLTPPDKKKIIQTDNFKVYYGGSEANTAIALSMLGDKCSFVSSIPQNEIGDSVLRYLMGLGVDVSYIKRCGERLGIYFSEMSSGFRGSNVIYDRKNSSFSKSTKEDYDWDCIFENCDIFHFSGITPALGEELVSILEVACKKAKEKNITISVDLNYRKKLWDINIAREIMSKLCCMADILITNESQAQEIFDIYAGEKYIEGGHLDKDGIKLLSRKLCNKFNLKKTAITIRTTMSGDTNLLGSAVYQNLSDEIYFSHKYKMENMLDRIGGGDAFTAGILHTEINKSNIEFQAEFAISASVLKHYIHGDAVLISEKEIVDFMNNRNYTQISR